MPSFVLLEQNTTVSKKNLNVFVSLIVPLWKTTVQNACCGTLLKYTETSTFYWDIRKFQKRKLCLPFI